jgi:hypothetical protein
MKKIYLFIVMLFIMNAGFAQTPRLVFVEEFTGETCGPCAAYNPGFNTTLNSLPSMVLALKYQNHIPTPGPNFYQYGITDIDLRSVYYNNYSGANAYSPHGFIDGNYWDGNVANVTASQLTTRGAVMSPFSVDVTHSFSAAHDIIYVHAVIRATQAVNGTTLKARIAVAERDVYGYTSPNGESEYSHVMRKMLPDPSGIALPSAWAVGDSVQLDYNWTIATPGSSAIDMPIWAMLEGMVWVQDDATKEILQSGHSPAQIAVDAAASELQLDAVSCSGTVTPVLVVQNKETGPITDMDIEYYIDSQSPATYSWSGNVAGGASVNVALPSVSVAQGAHVANANIVTVNGAAEVVGTNNAISGNTGQAMTAVASYTQNFLPVNFTLMNWIINNPDNFIAWARVANTATPGSGSAKMDFYDSPAGEIDYLYNLNALDFSTAPSPELRFKVAHKRYSANEADKLEVIASSDCGQTWTTVWSKTAGLANNNLATVTGYVTSAYAPAAADWRQEIVNLSQFIGQPNVVIGFKATSDYGNNVFVDEINLSGITGIAEQNPDLFSLYPVPSRGEITLSLDKIKSQDFSIAVSSIDGQVVKEVKAAKAGNEYKLDLSDLNTGSYFLKIISGSETSVKKIVIEK